MSNRPQFENAPGLVLRSRSDGRWEARWLCRTDLATGDSPFEPRVVRLAIVSSDPSEAERAFVSDQCTRLQSEMLVWGRGGIPQLGAKFDGTLRSLIDCYLNDPDSTFHKGRYKSRLFNKQQCARIARSTWVDEGVERAMGDVELREIKARTILRWHEAWGAGGKVAMARSLIGTLRTICGFGRTILEDEHCARVSGLLSGMRFKMAPPRSERMTAEQAIAIRAMAHKMGHPSIALAQAFQFECTLRQKDVIGEWVPLKEPGPPSDVTYRGLKWLRGIRWSEIDENMVLRHTTSKRQKDLEVDLKLAPMVMEELERTMALSAGPIVVTDDGRPWNANQFRRHWRKIARAAGVPDVVYNMDSRAGAITEGTDSGASLEDVRHAATHGDIAMTQKYSRGSSEKVARVMQMRVVHRNKPRTTSG